MNEIKKFDVNGVNKFLITGFHDSDNMNVSSLFDANGVKYAKPSKNEKMTASEISETILKTLVTSTNSKTTSISSPIWDSLALDLFLGNIDQKLWHWSDSKALELLDYWKKIDNQIAFILVYNSPEQIVSELLDSGVLKSADEIDGILEEWSKYNEKLLSFYYKNQEKSLLLHINQINENQEYCLKVLHEKTGIAFKEFTKNSQKELKSTKGFEKNSIQDFLITYAVQENLKVQKVYEELQSVANIFNENQQFSDTKKVLNDFLLHKQKFLNLESSKKTSELDELEKIKNSLKEKDEENELILQQLYIVQEELEEYYLENQRIKDDKKKKKYYGAAERVKKQLSYRLGAKMIEKSNSLIGIVGLPFSLLVVYLEYKKDMKENRNKKLPSIEVYADANDAKRVKKHLSYMLGQTMIKTMKASLFGILILPFRLQSTYKLYKQQRKEV